MPKTKSQTFLDLLDDTVSRTEYLKASKQVLEIILKKEQKLEQAINEMRNTFLTLQKKLGDDNSLTKTELNTLIGSQLKNMVNKFDLKGRVIDDKLALVRDGKDADETVIVGKVLEQIVLPEQKEIILDDAMQLREKLESLEGEDELRLTALEEFAKRIEALEKRPLGGKTPYGGSVVHKFMDDKDTLTGDGSTVAFTLAKAPINLQLFRGGALQNEGTGNDFVLAGKTVTFKSAPAVGETLKAFYRYF